MSLALEADKHLRVINKNDEEMAENMQNMTNEELKKRILDSEHNLLESERGRKNDRALSKAKDKYLEYKAPWDDAKKYQSAIIAYGTLLLEERGK